MTKPHYLIIGQGDIGLPVTNQLAKLGFKVTGLARKKRAAYTLEECASFLQADALSLSVEQIKHFTHIAIIVTPDTYNMQDYKNVYYGIAQHIAEFADTLPVLERVVFISSTGVYGQDSGEWIDETVQPHDPSREASTFILKAEQVLQQAFGKKTVVIRPSGIYGKERLMRIRKARETGKKPLPRYAWTNRIMDSDLINIIVQVLTLKDEALLKPVYLATDYAPVTSYELTYWLSEQLNSELPEMSETSQITGKRLHSNIPRNWLAYPDWQSGYSEILKYL